MEAGATKSINEMKESRLVANTKVTLRANAAIKTGSKRRASGATPKLKLIQALDMLNHYTILPAHLPTNLARACEIVPADGSVLGDAGTRLSSKTRT